MADETQNPATQVSSGVNSLISGLWTAVSSSERSWRGLIGLTLILGFILVYQGKLSSPAPVPVKQDNSDVLSSVSEVRKDIAVLKAQLAASAEDVREQLDSLKTVPAVKPKPRKQPISAAISP